MYQYSWVFFKKYIRVYELRGLDMEKDNILKFLEDIQSNDINISNVEKLKKIMNHIFSESEFQKYVQDNQFIANLLFTYLKIYTCPVVIQFYDELENKIVRNNGSGVLLDLGNGPFLVTNNHVIMAYKDKVNRVKEIGNEPLLMIGNVIVDIKKSLIDINETLDLASIRITEEDLLQISKESYKEPYKPHYGPPSDYSELRGETAIVVGYPGVFRTDSVKASELEYAVFSGEIMDTSDISIKIPLVIEQSKRVFGNRDLNELDDSNPEEKSRLGGFSGGGVFILANDGSIHLIGITKENIGFIHGVQASLSSLINTDGTFCDTFDLYK
jgi:hypothetical protein